MSRFFSGEKKILDPVVLSHRRIFILPSKQGLGFVGLIVILLLIALVYNNNLIYMLGFLLGSVFFITILHSFKSLSGLVLSTGRHKNVFAGQAAEFTVVIDNPTTTDRFNLQIKLEQSKAFDLPAHSKHRVKLYSQTHRRGRHNAGTVTVFSFFPLGLFRTWSPVHFDLEVLVYPKPSNIERPFPENPDATGEQGTQLHGNDDFYGVKSYQPGDAIKHIYWKAYAKGQGVFSKQYDGGKSSEQIWLSYEQCPGRDVEERLSQLCQWLIDAEQAGICYGFELLTLQLPPSNGSRHFHQCLQALALF